MKTSGLRIVLIGSGNLATNLGCALKERGEVVLQVYSRTLASAQLLANRIGCACTTSFSELKEADLYLVALKDDALPIVLPELIKGREKALFVHTAGSVPASIFSSYTDRFGVFYPMQTFSKQRVVSFKNIPFFIEANREEDRLKLLNLASHLSEVVMEADSEQRKALHLAAVFTSNFSNHMYTLAAKLLEDKGLPFQSMLSLLDETAQKVHEIAPVDAQTGPAIRNDQEVMADHMQMLSGDKELQQL